MKTSHIIIIAFVIFLVVVQFTGYAQDEDIIPNVVDTGPLSVVQRVISIVGNGKRLSHCTYDADSGVVTDDPADLVTEAKGISDVVSQGADANEVYSLARVIRSEIGNAAGGVGRQAIGWACYNRAQQHGTTVTDLVTKNGHYVSERGGAANGSTRQDPYESDAIVALEILYGGSIDITGGATYWDSPRAQAALLLKMTPRYSKTPQQVAANRIASGLEEVDLPGVSSNLVRFWRKKVT